jgi:AraC-like DNA-binding protein
MLRKRRSAADEPFFLVRAGVSESPAGRRITHHHHDHWHQLLYVSAGLLAVDTDRGTWLSPPNWAVWAPAGATHAPRFVAASSFRTLYFRPDPRLDLPAECCTLAVSPLLRELILRTGDAGMLDERDPVEAAIAALILSELGRSGPPPFTLPQPVSDMTRQAAQLLASDAPGTLAAVARAVGLGARTLERRFHAETGLTPGRWRQQRKLMVSLELIASGERVKTAAAAAGFASASAYVAAFRKVFGATPARYFAPP